MAETTVKVDTSTRDTLQGLAAAEGLSVKAYLAKVAGEKEQERALRTATAAFRRVISEPGATGNGYTNLPCSEVAGKTGTSEEESDAWFVGYTPEYSTAVWVGHPQSREYTGFGGPTAGPIWRSYMESAQEGDCPEFEVPSTLPSLSGFSSEHTRSSSEVSSEEEGEEEEENEGKKKPKKEEAEEEEAEEGGEEAGEEETHEEEPAPPPAPEHQGPPPSIGGGVAPG